MTTLTIRPEQEEKYTPQTDPYPYGWRDVKKVHPNGYEEWVREPLTLEDILHPQVGDYRMHSQEHERFLVYLQEVFSKQVAHDPKAIVLLDVRTAWDHPTIKPHGPDISVIFGVKAVKDWSTFAEKEEGTRPTVIVEVTSPRTRSTDLLDKVDEYEQVGVEYYFIVDTLKRRGEKRRRLLGYRLTERGYMALNPNAQGWLWVEPVQVWLGLEGLELVCYDESGQPFGNYAQVALALEEVTLQVEVAETRAEVAETRAEVAETRAEIAETRAEVAEAQAKVEAEARLALEARLEAMAAELERLQST